VQLAYGELMLIDNRTQEALEAFRAASNLLHDDPQVEARLGQVLLAMGRAEPALEHLRAAADRGFAPPDVQRALVLALIQEGLLSEAQRVLDTIPVGGRQATEILRGLLLYERGELEDAARVLTGVAEIRGNDPVVLNLLGSTLYRQQAYEEAVEILQKAHDLQPDQEVVLINLERARAARDAVRLGREARIVRP
jgi:tetratricopeptide (TPR) repeat protein